MFHKHLALRWVTAKSSFNCLPFLQDQCISGRDLPLTRLSRLRDDFVLLRAPENTAISSACAHTYAGLLPQFAISCQSSCMLHSFELSRSQILPPSQSFLQTMLVWLPTLGCIPAAFVGDAIESMVAACRKLADL